ncbi:DNA damage-regulated autophagy modulator protein 1 [Aphelenchoides fujianensis]|nr:DNA damage-regulated autophagy modulator protein 1 [Aphelenchoides fujianensis]
MRYLFAAGRLGAGHLPVIFTIIFTLMLGCTYCFSVWRGDVDPVFPYISASGDNRPESCLFSMFLNICAMLSIVIINLRYNLIAELVRDSNDLLKRLNNYGLYLGTFAATGMFIVANFQETAVIQIHLFGAFVCFGGGCLYMLIQSWISHLMCPLFAGRRVAYIRSVIAAISVLAFFTALIFGILAANRFHKFHPDQPTPRPWNHLKHKEGYELHCISALAEWTLALLHTGFLLSYSRDFETIRCTMSVQPLARHLDDSPDWGSQSDLQGQPLLGRRN